MTWLLILLAWVIIEAFGIGYSREYANGKSHEGMDKEE